MISYIFKLTVILICATEASCAEFIVHPQNATVTEGDNITIPCVFNDKVSFCKWYRGPGNVLNIDMKWPYSYNDAGTNGTNTRDCSIIITKFTTIDEGFWQCSGVQMNKYRETANIIIELKSNKARLTMVNPIITTKATTTQKATLEKSEVAVHPQNATVVQGGYVLLKCIFRETIDKCVWLRNGTTVKINGRYTYYNVKANGELTHDCSIEINRFDNIDATHWKCSCNVNDTSGKCETSESTPAFLELNTSGESTSRVAVHPQNATVKVGGYVLLRCIFKESITKCVWFRNGTSLNISDRYIYHNVIANLENTYDCSINIIKFSEIDATHWHCTCALNDSLKDIETCKSNSAYLTLVQPDRTAPEPDESSVNTTNLVILIAIGALLVTIISLIAIWCRRNYKGKRNRRRKPSPMKIDASQCAPDQELYEEKITAVPRNEDKDGYLIANVSKMNRNSINTDNDETCNIYEEIL